MSLCPFCLLVKELVVVRTATYGTRLGALEEQSHPHKSEDAPWMPHPSIDGLCLEGYILSMNPRSALNGDTYEMYRRRHHRPTSRLPSDV